MAMVPALAGTVAAVLGAAPAGAQVDNGPGETLHGDVDGDGLDDKVTLHRTGHLSDYCPVSVRINNGFGGYHQAVGYVYDALGSPESYCADMGVVVDLGTDGVVELVLTWSVGSPPGVGDEILVLRDFQPAGSFEAVFQPSGIGLADFDGDGDDDVYEYTDQGDGFRTYLNTAAGTLEPGPVRHTGANAQAFEIADFDQDGAMDLLAPYLNEGDPTLPQTGVNVVLDDGTVVVLEARQLDFSVWQAQVVDGNADGIPDVEITNPETGDVVTYLSNGDGTFTAAK